MSYLSYFSEPNDPFRTFEVLRRRMDQLLRDFDGPAEPARATIWPRASLRDEGAALVVEAEVPGLGEADIEVTATMEALTIKGERKNPAPEGYAAHRRERGAFKFARSVALPAKIDVEQVSATVKDGLLTVTLPKRPEAQPRTIAVKGAAKAE